MTVTVRFAPSPTGFLHVGNIRVALINWLYGRAEAKKQGTNSVFLLRFDDTDPERCKQEYADALQEDLTWLGLVWDKQEKQSERTSHYEKAVAKLKADGRLYPCYETAEELEYKRKRQRARGKPPIYDRAAMALTDAEKAAYEAEGRKPHWRFVLKHEETSWDDLVRGTCKYNGAHLSDPILVREDGSFLYTLPSVVDDAALDVTHVLRGEDHVVNTAVQIQIFEALGYTAPTFAHFSLLTDPEGNGLSKRMGSIGIRHMRENGIQPMALNSLLGKLGTSDPVQLFADLNGLVDTFDIQKFGRAAAKFDEKELSSLNTACIHGMPFADAKPKLEAAGVNVAGMTDAFWDAVRPNIDKLDDVADWWAIVDGAITPVIDDEDKDYIDAAALALPDGDWTAETWGAWTASLKASTGRKGKGLFMPLRKALTGQQRGPEMAVLLPLLTREKVVARLAGAKA